MLRFVAEERLANCDYHIATARKWRMYGESGLLQSPLAYASFEYRCGIERHVFEKMCLRKNLKLSGSDLKRCRKFSDMIALIYRIEGGKEKFAKSNRFAQLYMQMDLAPYELSLADLGKLQKFWTELSEFCHLQPKPGDTWLREDKSWVKKGYQLLNRVEGYLWQILVTQKSGWLDPDTLEPEAQELRADFLQGRRSESEVKGMLELMKPILQQRTKIKRAQEYDY